MTTMQNITDRIAHTTSALRTRRQDAGRHERNGKPGVSTPTSAEAIRNLEERVARLEAKLPLAGLGSPTESTTLRTLQDPVRLGTPVTTDPEDAG